MNIPIKNRYINRNYTSGRRGKSVKQITFHTAVSNAKSLYSYFNNKGTDASSHYYVNSEGLIEKYVREKDTAWANSNLDSNIRSITIETWDKAKPWDKKRTNALYESCAQLAAKLSNQYSIPLKLLSKSEAFKWKKGFTKHSYFANKSCPAGLDYDRILQRAKQITNGSMIVNVLNNATIRKEASKDSDTICNVANGGRACMVGAVSSYVQLISMDYVGWTHKGNIEEIKPTSITNKDAKLYNEIITNYNNKLMAYEEIVQRQKANIQKYTNKYESEKERADDAVAKANNYKIANERLQYQLKECKRDENWLKRLINLLVSVLKNLSEAIKSIIFQ